MPQITGQTNPNVVLLLSQQQSYPADNTQLSAVIQAQRQASVTHPGDIVCIGPKYQYGYVADAVHMPAAGYARLGEKYAQAFWQTVMQHTPFVPLSPNTARRTTQNSIVLSLHVPVPPLNWDPLLPQPHQSANTAWSEGRGFEVTDPNGAMVQIAAVDIDALQTSVTLTLANAPNTALHLNYAMTPDAAVFCGGLAGGRVGALRDSDPLVGASAQTLTCLTTQGSETISCAEGLEQRALYDAVSPGPYALTALDANDTTRATLSAPWSGATGAHDLLFAHEHRNYLVSFTLLVDAM